MLQQREDLEQLRRELYEEEQAEIHMRKLKVSFRNSKNDEHSE